MAKKPNYSQYNKPIIEFICVKNGYEYEYKSPDQIRIYGATHIIDIWPARMVYHRIQGENIKSIEPYHRGLKWKADKKQLETLLETGELN